MLGLLDTDARIEFGLQDELRRSTMLKDRGGDRFGKGRKLD